jgi:predicted Zn-dependent protease
MVAWVVAHEMTHVSRQHAVRRIERQMGYDLVIALIFKQGDVAQLASVAAGLMLLDYGRDNEFEADRYGMGYAQAAGYDPSAAVAVLEEFQEIQGSEPSDFEIMFMTHPGNNDRINHAKDYIADQGWTGSYYTP